MLADVKLKLEPEASNAETAPPATQPRAVLPLTQSQVPLGPAGTISHESSLPYTGGKSVATHSNTETEYSVTNFGWEEIEDGPLLPYIKRGTEKFVANRIIIETVMKKIASVFSMEMINCLSLVLYPMTRSEADAFNDININHCDRSLVGAHIFKTGDNMIHLELVDKLNKYFYACRNSVLEGEKINDLFGFILIDGNNQVPFVWDNNKKLAPLFYFEGESQYIDSRSIDLTDPWKIGYLKFCCKVQKLRKDLYEQNPLKVVDFEDVKTLFPTGTTFVTHWPDKVNPELLATNLRFASSTVQPSAMVKRPAESSNEIEAKRARIGVISPPSITQSQQIKSVESAPPSERSHPVSVNVPPQYISRLSRDLTITPVSYSENHSSQVVEPATITPVPQRVRIQESHDIRQLPPQRLNNPGQFNNLVASRILQRLATGSLFSTPSRKNNLQQNVSTNKPTDIYHITDIPRQFRQVGLSRGDQQERVDTMPRYYQSNNFSPTDIPTEGTQQTCHISNSYQQMVNGNRERTANNVNHKVTGYDATHNSSTIAQNNLDDQPAYPGYSSKIPHTSVSSQIGQYPPTYNSPALNNQNPCVGEGEPLTVSLEAEIQQIATEQSILSKVEKNLSKPGQWVNHRRNMQQLKMIIDQRYQQKTHQNSVLPCPPSINKIGLNYDGNLSASMGYQPISSSKPSIYQQQYSNINVPMVQNVNVAVTNVMVVENQAQEYLPRSVTTVITSNKFGKDGECLTLNLRVNDHVLVNNPRAQSYTIKGCAIRDTMLLGIRKTLVSNDFLINLSELWEKVFGLLNTSDPYKVLPKFKSLYKLNPEQKAEWSKAIKERQLQLVGPFKGVFVEYSHLASVLKSLELRSNVSHCNS